MIPENTTETPPRFANSAPGDDISTDTCESGAVAS